MVDPTGPYTPYWDQNAFELGVDGKLQSKIIFDYEGQKFYDLKIIVSDEKGGQVKKDFRITVTNDIWDDPEVIAQMDDDQDGLSNGNEEFLGTDRNNPDTDGDGWLDGAEFEAQSNPLVADSDGDGLNDFEEHNRGTDPMQADTDGDGYNDKDEIDAGTLPEDRLDYPRGSRLSGGFHRKLRFPRREEVRDPLPYEGENLASGPELCHKAGGFPPRSGRK